MGSWSDLVWIVHGRQLESAALLGFPHLGSLGKRIKKNSSQCIEKTFLFEFSRLVHIQLPFIANPTNRCGRLRGITTLSLLTFLLMRTQAHPFLSRRISNSRLIPCPATSRVFAAILDITRQHSDSFLYGGSCLRSGQRESESSYRSVALVSEKQPGIGEGTVGVGKKHSQNDFLKS